MATGGFVLRQISQLMTIYFSSHARFFHLCAYWNSAGHSFLLMVDSTMSTRVSYHFTPNTRNILIAHSNFKLCIKKFGRAFRSNTIHISLQTCIIEYAIFCMSVSGFEYTAYRCLCKKNVCHLLIPKHEAYCPHHKAATPSLIEIRLGRRNFFGSWWIGLLPSFSPM